MEGAVIPVEKQDGTGILWVLLKKSGHKKYRVLKKLSLYFLKYHFIYLVCMCVCVFTLVQARQQLSCVVLSFRLVGSSRLGSKHL